MGLLASDFSDEGRLYTFPTLQQELAKACGSAATTLQRKNADNLKQIFPEKEYWDLSPNFHHSCVCERIIYSHDGSVFSAGGNMWTDPGNI